MKRTRLIYLIATVFSLLVSFPRVLFLMRGDEDAVVNQIIEVTAFDTGFRILLLFGFTFVVLKFNLEWNTKIAERKRLWAIGVDQSGNTCRLARALPVDPCFCIRFLRNGVRSVCKRHDLLFLSSAVGVVEQGGCFG